MASRVKRFGLPILLLVLIGGGIYFYLFYYTQYKQKGRVFFGNVEIKEIDLSFNVSGRLKEMLFEEGDYVKKSTLLAKIDDDIYKDDLQAAQSNMKSIEADLTKAKLNLSMLQTSYNKGLISKKEYTDYSAIVDSMQHRFNGEKARVKISQTRLNDTTLIAPSDGIIITKILENGSIVPIAQPVYTLLLQETAQIRSYVDEPDLGKIYHGMLVTVKTDGGDSYEGKIGFISPKAEFTPKNVETQQLRSELVYRFKVVVKNPDHKLKQGMPVSIYVDRPEKKGDEASN